MKRIILKTLEQLGYKLMRVDEWSALQGQWGFREAGIGTLEAQLTNCLNDCHRLGLRGDRAEARIQALARSRDHVRADLQTCRELAAAEDPSGRLGELENENRRLQRQLADLEVYLRETREASGVSYL